jgi:hypothetical protein
MGLTIDRNEQKIWRLSDRILWLSRTDALTLEEACLGILGTGGNGSGKTTALINHALRLFCRQGFGGVILCAKLDAAEEYRQIIQSEGRTPIMFGGDSHHAWNFIDYESRRYGYGQAIIENLVVILSSSSEIVSRKYGERSGDKFWEDARDQMLRNCLWVAVTATGGIDLRSILRMIQTLPRSSADLQEPERFYSLQMLRLAEERAGGERAVEVSLARDYFCDQIPHLSDRTLSSIVLTLSVLLDSFLRFPLADLFGGESTVTPDDIVTGGQIVVINVPTKQYELIGKVAGVLWKTSVQRAIERNPALLERPADEVRPTFILADEFPAWACSHDTHFQSTARSSRGISCYATQTIKAIESEMGGDPTSAARVQWLLSTLQTRFYFQNSCIENNRFAADAIGKAWTPVPNGNEGVNVDPKGGRSQNAGAGWNFQHLYRVDPSEFIGLPRGGKQYRFEVEAIVTSAGRRFKINGERWVRTTFRQFKERPVWRMLFDQRPYVYIAVAELRFGDWCLRRIVRPLRNRLENRFQQWLENHERKSTRNKIPWYGQILQKFRRVITKPKVTN